VNTLRIKHSCSTEEKRTYSLTRGVPLRAWYVHVVDCFVDDQPCLLSIQTFSCLVFARHNIGCYVAFGVGSWRYAWLRGFACAWSPQDWRLWQLRLRFEGLYRNIERNTKDKPTIDNTVIGLYICLYTCLLCDIIIMQISLQNHICVYDTDII